MDNAGYFLDELGVTCEQLFKRFTRTGNYVAQQAMWDALEEFHTKAQIIDAQTPDQFGAEA